MDTLESGADSQTGKGKISSPREWPIWLRTILTLIAIVSAGATLMGWVQHFSGEVIIAVGAPAYLLWESWPWLERRVRHAPVLGATCALLMGILIASCAFYYRHLLFPPAVILNAPTPPSPTIIFQSVKRIGGGSSQRLSLDTEIQRRDRVADKLREKYCLEHPACSADILEKKSYPPTDWMNGELKSLGESWRMEDKDHPFKVSEYEAMTSPELQQTALALVSQLRKFAVEREDDMKQRFLQKQAKVPPPFTTREDQIRWWNDQNAKDIVEDQKWDDQFKSQFQPRCASLMTEVEKRTPNFQLSVYDSMSKSMIARGGLSGPDPVGEIANYIARRADSLPTK